MNEKKGTMRSLLYFAMANESSVTAIEKLVDEMLADNPSYFRVNVKIKPTNNIKVYLDADEGLPIEQCVKFNRQLYKLIEDSSIFPPGEFSLEVSSPGVGEPLIMHRQYVKNKGRFLEVTLQDELKKEGKLIEVTDSEIVLENVSGKGKKAITQNYIIPFENIKTTSVQIKF